MKKILVTMFLLVFSLCLVGCEQIKGHIQIDNLSSINKIVIREYDGSSGEIMHNVIVEMEDQIKYICDNFTALSLKKFADKNEPTAIIYYFAFYNNDKEVELIGVTAQGWISYDGSFYSVEKDEIDYDYINSLFVNAHNYIDGLCDCGVFDNVWLNENFRLSDEKILFKGSVDDEFNCDVIALTLKHTTTYIELSKRHFGIENITKVEYVGGARPPEYFFEEEYKHLLETYNQIVFLHVDVESKEEIIEMIKELEKLPFVRSANANYILQGD